jgi:hypothetical protein
LKKKTINIKGAPTIAYTTNTPSMSALSHNMISIAPPAYSEMNISYSPSTHSNAPPPYSGAPGEDLAQSEKMKVMVPAALEAPPPYSGVPGEDLAAQVEQMKATMEQMRLEKGAMMWKMHLEKVEMMGKMDKMRLEKEAVTEQVHRERDAVIEQMRLKMEKRICEEKERVQVEKKVFVAKEKHWSSDFDSWYKNCSMPAASKQILHSVVSAFLKTISTETIYAIHSITINDYGICRGDGSRPSQYSHVRMYIATDSKVYTLDYGGDVTGGNFQIFPPSVFKAIVTFPSEPTPTFWRAVFSQMGQGNTVFQHNYGNNEIFRVATAKLEALFHSFR